MCVYAYRVFLSMLLVFLSMATFRYRSIFESGVIKNTKTIITGADNRPENHSFDGQANTLSAISAAFSAMSIDFWLTPTCGKSRGL